MLGHANIEQTSTYLNVTLQVIRSLTKALDRTRGRATNRASPAPLATRCKRTGLRPSRRSQRYPACHR
jgi:hypothetical protein